MRLTSGDEQGVRHDTSTAMSHKLSRLFVLFVSGAVALCLEFLCPRILAPVHGSGHVVWSSVVAVALTAFAVGYWRGGVAADVRDPRVALPVCLGAAGTWLVVVYFLRAPLVLWMVPLGVPGAPLASATLVLFVPVALLAAVYPLVVRSLTDDLAMVGRTVGVASGVSAIGSIGGALATSFVLVPRLGVGNVLLGCAAATYALAALTLLGKRPRAAVSSGVLGLLAVGGASFARGPLPENIVHFESSMYSTIVVRDDAPTSTRTLYLDSVAHSSVDSTTFESPGHTLLALELPIFMRPEARRVLVIGLGAGVLPRIFEERYGLEVDSVEIDPALARVARAFFRFPADSRVIVDDGRNHLRRHEEFYDLIVLDAASSDSHPFHLYTTEAFALCAKRLGRRGVLAINLIASATDPIGVVSANSILSTLRTQFAHAVILQSELGSTIGATWQTFAVYASAEPLDFERDPTTGRPEIARYHQLTRNRARLELLNAVPGAPLPLVLTDDHSPLDLWSAELLLAERVGLLRDLDDGRRSELERMLAHE